MTTDDSLRADARANRDRLIDVARRALAADPAASLHSIARAAGVGQGTLYRHFPTREALLLAVYHQDVEALVALAPALLAAHPPLDAFHLWCERFAQYGRWKQGISAMLHSAMSDKDFDTTYWPMVDAVRQLLVAGQDAGAIQPGFDGEDVLRLLAPVMQLPATPEGEARAGRLLALIFRGLQADVTGAG